MRRGVSAAVLLLAGVLAACAPAATLPPSRDSDQAVLNITGTPPTLLFGAGISDVVDLAITIKGKDLRVNAPEFCKPANVYDVLCTVPRLPAGKNFVLPMRGSNLSAVATYKRGNGQSYSSVARQ